MRRIRDSLHKWDPGGHKVENRDHSTRLLPPPTGELLAGLWRKKLCQEPPGGTALRGFDFDMAISDTLNRTYVPDEGLRRLRRKRNVIRETDCS